MTTFGANIRTTIKVLCSVASYPDPENFSWAFNNSKETLQVKSDKYSMNGSVSTLHYSIRSDHHFGHLYCWATNSQGVNTEPCVFNIIPARPPTQPNLCKLVNQTTDLLHVECEAGFDGGLDQTFNLQVIDVASGVVLTNVSNSVKPFFSITGLHDCVNYFLTP